MEQSEEKMDDQPKWGVEAYIDENTRLHITCSTQGVAKIDFDGTRVQFWKRLEMSFPLRLRGDVPENYVPLDLIQHMGSQVSTGVQLMIQDEIKKQEAGLFIEADSDNYISGDDEIE